jgi:F-type H+-transporting ATPase subunit b
MPQFDPSSFTSQLFWLAICFSLIYFSMSRIFLPRVRNILKDRHDKISDNNVLSLQLKEQIDEIDAVSKNLRDTSISQYHLSIEQSIKAASLKKEESLQNLKTQITKMVEESKLEMVKFKQNSQNDGQKIINQLVDELSNKFFENKTN